MGVAGLPVAEGYVQCGEFRLEGGYRRTLKMMKLVPRPAALFATNTKYKSKVKAPRTKVKTGCEFRRSVRSILPTLKAQGRRSSGPLRFAFWLAFLAYGPDDCAATRLR